MRLGTTADSRSTGQASPTYRASSRPVNVNILGAGQCGTLLATIMARHVPSIELYERGRDPREADGLAGRSINLALAARGIRALETANVMPYVKPLLVPMRGRMIHDVDGSTEFQPYGQRADEQIYSVSRGHLNQVLLNAAEERGNVNIRFQQEALGYDSSRCTVRFRDRTNGEDYEVAAAPLIAADGAGSVACFAMVCSSRYEMRAA